jgi:hypothetical protein
MGFRKLRRSRTPNPLHPIGFAAVTKALLENSPRLNCDPPLNANHHVKAHATLWFAFVKLRSGLSPYLLYVRSHIPIKLLGWSMIA